MSVNPSCGTCRFFVADYRPVSFPFMPVTGACRRFPAEVRKEEQA